MAKNTNRSDQGAGNEAAKAPPFLRVEVRVSYVCATEGIEVPLGYLDNGRWIAPPFIDDHAEVDGEELAEWLALEQPFDPPLAFSPDHARAMVRDTFERCRALAEASAAHRMARG